MHTISPKISEYTFKVDHFAVFVVCLMNLQIPFDISVGRKRLMNYTNTIKSVEKNSTNDVLFINSMARLHNLLCEIVDDLNACFSIQVNHIL